MNTKYIQKLIASGAPVVGPSADWVNTAVRVSGTVDAGRVVFEDDAGGLELIEYTHNEDGDRTDVVVARLDRVTGAELSPMTDAEWLEAATEHDVTYGEAE